LTNLFFVPATLDEMLALPKESFDTFEELLAAGWRIDLSPTPHVTREVKPLTRKPSVPALPLSAKLRVPAIELRQGGRALYSFVVDGKRVHEFAAISRIRRSEGEIQGYQRPEVLAHVAGIRAYLEGEGAILPNAWSSPSTTRSGSSRSGAGSPSPTAAWARCSSPCVATRTGQVSSSMASNGLRHLREASLASFPVCVSASWPETRPSSASSSSFVNSTRPLPRSLVYELLPVAGNDLLLFWRSGKSQPDRPEAQRRRGRPVQGTHQNADQP